MWKNILRKLVVTNWDLGNILSLIGIIASVANILVVIYIYTKWTTQKQREVIANDAGILIKEITSLGEDVISNLSRKSIDGHFINQVSKRKKSIHDSLGMIKTIDENLPYEYYIISIENIVNALLENPELSDESVLHRFWIAEYELTLYLKRLRLFA